LGSGRNGPPLSQDQEIEPAWGSDRQRGNSAEEVPPPAGNDGKTKTKKGVTTDKIGDAYTFVAIERGTKVVLAHAHRG
jgi:hypothetical protein